MNWSSSLHRTNNVPISPCEYIFGITGNIRFFLRHNLTQHQAAQHQSMMHQYLQQHMPTQWANIERSWYFNQFMAGSTGQDISSHSPTKRRYYMDDMGDYQAG